MSTNTDTYFTYTTPHGLVTFRATTRGIAEITFKQADFNGMCQASALTNQAATELQEYLAGKRQVFTTPLDLQGSAFQTAVWTEISTIPYGTTCTSAEIANALGKPGSYRSVGTAIRACHLTPFIPAHRVPVPNATGKLAKIFRAFIALEQRNAAKQ